jgi:hypothetical protein
LNLLAKVPLCNTSELQKIRIFAHATFQIFSSFLRKQAANHSRNEWKPSGA